MSQYKYGRRAVTLSFGDFSFFFFFCLAEIGYHPEGLFKQAWQGALIERIEGQTMNVIIIKSTSSSSNPPQSQLKFVAPLTPWLI